METGAVTLEIPLGFEAPDPEVDNPPPIPRPGFRGKLRLRATPWNNWNAPRENFF